jgi:hypothetical protein
MIEIGHDIIECERERLESSSGALLFRQGCHIGGRDSNGQVESTVELKLKDKIKHRGIDFDLRPVFRNLCIEQETEQGEIECIPLRGLNPILKLSIEWTNDEKCKGSNSLWSHEISIIALDPEDKLPGYIVLEKQIDYGSVDYEYDLTEKFLPNLLFWKYQELQDDYSRYLVRFAIYDVDYSPGKPFPTKRISPECKMVLTYARLGFDAEEMADDIKFLNLLASAESQVLVRSTVLHAFLVGEQIGALCSILDLAETLGSVEKIGDEYSALSFLSKQAIAAAVEEAVSAGAISMEAIPIKEEAGYQSQDYWGYFVTNLATIKSECESNSQKKYAVSTEPFKDGSTVTHQKGFNNAKVYERSWQNLHKYMTAAWAIIQASSYDLEQAKELEWMIDSSIYEGLLDEYS